MVWMTWGNGLTFGNRKCAVRVIMSLRGGMENVIMAGVLANTHNGEWEKLALLPIMFLREEEDAKLFDECLR